MSRRTGAVLNKLLPIALEPRVESLGSSHQGKDSTCRIFPTTLVDQVAVYLGGLLEIVYLGIIKGSDPVADRKTTVGSGEDISGTLFHDGELAMTVPLPGDLNTRLNVEHMP